MQNHNLSRIVSDSFEYLRPQKAEQSRETYHNLENRSGKLNVVKLENCSAKVYYDLSSFHANDSAIEIIRGGVKCCVSTRCKRKAEKVKGNTLFGGFFLGAWGHFLVETCARLWYIYDEESEKIDNIIFVAFDPNVTELKGNIRQFFELSGLLNKIRIISYEELQFEKLIIPEMAITHWTYAKEFIKIFNAVKQSALASTNNINVNCQNNNKKIFLTRSQLKNSKKYEINIEYLDKFFANNGYEIVSPEKIELADLIKLFHSSKEIVSICGSLAHNILFANPGTDFSIIERHGFINSWQMVCNICSDNSVTYVDCYELPTMSDALGPVFLYQSTDCFKEWSKNKNLNIEDSFPQTDKQKKQELRRFLKYIYKTRGYTPRFLPYDLKRGPVYAEAILRAERRYNIWLRRQKPLFLKDYFNIRCNLNWWIKPLVKKMLRRQ